MPIGSRTTTTATTPRRPAKSKQGSGQLVIGGWGAMEPNKGKAPREQHELAEQKTLFYHLQRWEARHPVLEWVHSSLNGLPLTPKVMRDATESGMTSGIWDLFIPCQRHGFGGLYVEMKWDDNDLSANQKRFLAHIKAENYAHAKCWSWIAAVRAIVDYLGIEDADIEETLRINMKASTQAVPIYGDGRPGKKR